MCLEDFIRQRARIYGMRVVAVDKLDYVDLEVMELPEALRGRGVGTRFVTEICAEADRLDETIGLSPEGSTPENTQRLRSWYRRFGFVENQDLTRYRVRFIRVPKASPRPQRNPVVEGDPSV